MITYVIVCDTDKALFIIYTLKFRTVRKFIHLLCVPAALRLGIIHSILTYCKKSAFIRTTHSKASQLPLSQCRALYFLCCVWCHIPCGKPLKRMLKTFKPFIKPHSKGIPNTENQQIEIHVGKEKRQFFFDFLLLVFIFHNSIKFFSCLLGNKFVQSLFEIASGLTNSHKINMRMNENGRTMDENKMNTSTIAPIHYSEIVLSSRIKRN